METIALSPEKFEQIKNTTHYRTGLSYWDMDLLIAEVERLAKRVEELERTKAG